MKSVLSLLLASLLCVSLVFTLTACDLGFTEKLDFMGQSNSSSAPSSPAPSSPAPSSPAPSSPAPSSPAPSSPATSIPEKSDISSSVPDSSLSENNPEATAGKLEYVYTLDDERVQFRFDKEIVGTEAELQQCKDIFETNESDLGKLIIYSENEMTYYSDEFIDDILNHYSRTTLRTISKIPEQDPRALTRGISMAAFYDKQGNRICLSKWHGHLFWIELQDSESVLVFEGTLGVTLGGESGGENPDT